MAVGSSPKILTSSDEVAWTQQDSGLMAGGLNSVTIKMTCSVAVGGFDLAATAQVA